MNFSAAPNIARDDPASFVCAESIKFRKLRPQNIVHRLRNREMGFTVKHPQHSAREFYQNVYPNVTVMHVEKPACYLRKFSPDGKYLIAFSCDQTSLEIYTYHGCSAAAVLFDRCEDTELIERCGEESENYDIRRYIFEKLFKLKHVVSMDDNEKQLNRECSLFTNDGKYVIVGSALFIPEENRPHFYELYTNNEAIKPTASCPLEDYTLYIVDIKNGYISDSKDFKVDKIMLSHNQGVYLYNDTLAVLSIQHQTIHIFSIAEGTFIIERAIGRFCCPDESYLYNLGTAGTEATANMRAFREPTINSLKHKILIFLFRHAQAKVESGEDRHALRTFYRRFDEYKNLRMWKMQLLDDDHLLIKYANEDVVTLKTMEPNHTNCVFVFYNIWKNKVIGIYGGQSPELLYLYENFCDYFRNANLAYQTQFTCSPSNNIYSNLIHQRFKQTMIGARGGGVQEATKRILAQLPISAQSYSSSPYLDLGLFSYDDKWVSAMERPKACAEFPIRFFARDSSLLKFKIYAGAQLLPTSSNSRRLVAFTFHPTEPFAISVQRINAEYIANFHIRIAQVRIQR
ncbi:DET1 homolog [Toxorhynchites rutilus septentrionalis]|uniref:DET1 homolog n=1 Tax=Toxorhynchites rutilus septentrionalis TaxID=329112 RepID=UPI00247A43FF|nr:DET1 homolog [Toxorhynchites rutilus septentrionalis]